MKKITNVVYVEYPYRGHAYAIDVDETELRKGRAVRLPGIGVVQITTKEGYFPTVDPNITSTEEVLNARIVISKDDPCERTFRGDWKPLVDIINTAAAVNTLFTIKLTKKEYRRLEKGGLEEMKDEFTERAFSLLYLYEDYLGKDKPSLELFRTGSCP